MALLGANSTASWLILVPAIALIALGPVTISFAVGQMGFTTALLIMNNIIVPAGWSAGLVRFEDVAIGCGVSIVVGALFWPRGAGRALGHALADGFSTGARYLDAAVEYGVNHCDSRSPDISRPAHEIELAGAAGRRVDDAFRAYLAERGTKRLSMADAAKLVGGSSLLRLTADAVVDLWERDGTAVGGDREAARRELHGARGPLIDWYERTASALAGRGAVPEQLGHDEDGDNRLIEVVRRDLSDADGRAAATAVKIVWTADHIDAARRLQAEIAAPSARAASR